MEGNQLRKYRQIFCIENQKYEKKTDSNEHKEQITSKPVIKSRNCYNGFQRLSGEIKEFMRDIY